MGVRGLRHSSWQVRVGLVLGVSGVVGMLTDDSENGLWTVWTVRGSFTYNLWGWNVISSVVDYNSQ